MSKKFRANNKCCSSSSSSSSSSCECTKRPKKVRITCGPQDQAEFCVPISFEQELVTNASGALVPLSTVSQNTNNVRGVLKLRFDAALSTASYDLYVYNATATNDQVVAAHLHLGSASTNGPVVVNLFTGPQQNVDGLLSKGTITNNNIINTSVATFPVINTVASLYQAIRNQTIYVNVHSQLFPNGIIRGQIYTRNSCGCQ